MSLLMLNPETQVVNVEHPVKSFKDKDGNEVKFDRLEVRVWCMPDLAVLRFRDPSPTCCNAFKVGGKIPAISMRRFTVESGVTFIDCELA